MFDINYIFRQIWGVIGAVIGWVIAEFEPTFPLITVAIVFIVCDAWTAFQLDKRVKEKYPDKSTREKAKFTSFAFGKVVRETIPKRLMVIILAYLVEHWVFIHEAVPLSYIVTGIVCFEQAWSILENESSCRPASDSAFWIALKKILKDKTERHLNINLSDFEDDKKDKDNEE